MDNQTIDYYSRSAADTARRYEQVHSPLETHFRTAFVPGSRILDIGSGSGRDAALLQSFGHDVFCVEPTTALRDAAMAIHPSLVNRIASESLPDLGKPFGGEFDGVLCCAVLMHLHQHHLFDAAFAIRQVLKVNGRLLISLPKSRGDLSGNERDSNGRLFKNYAAGEMALLFLISYLPQTV